MSKKEKMISGILIIVLIIVIGIVIVYNLIEKSVTNREDFKFKVENNNSVPVETINHEQNEKTFFGKVIESDASYIIVEPNEDEEERKSAENFEILFYDKQLQSDVKEQKIIDKNETDKYDYDVYIYDGSVNIIIDGKNYSLKEALLENRITMEEIIAKANQDEKEGKIKVDMYKDGGSMEYNYENYTIIKCHTLDGNRDVYIGTKDLKLTDVI